MAVQGVGRNILELLVSKDKTMQEFMASVKPGDTLRGRVVEVMPDMGKALINFKGYTMVSELPQGSGIQKGDILSVAISQLGEKITMQLLAADVTALGKGAQPPATAVSLPAQLAQMLSDLKVPVNEQNVFIAQKLLSYHLPVTAQNINDINAALNNYLAAKGIDIRTFSMETPAVAREVLLGNLFKFNSEMAKAAGADIAAEQAAFASHGPEEALQAYLTPGAGTRARVDTAVKAINILNTMTEIAQEIRGVQTTADGASILFTVSDAKQALQNFASSALKDGLISQQDSQSLTNVVQSGGRADVSEGTVTVTLSGNSVGLRMNNLAEMVEKFTRPVAAQGQALVPVTELKQAFDNAVRTLSQPMPEAPAAATADPMQALAPQQQPALAAVREAFAQLKKDVLTPGGTDLNRNITDIAGAVNRLNVGVSMVKQAFVSMPAAPQNARYVQDASKLADAVNNLMQNTGIAASPEEFTVAPKEYAGFQSAMKGFITAAEGSQLIKPGAETAKQQPITIRTAAQLDMESAVEALVFLKSRNLPVDNRQLTDLMSKYFSDDMKLNQNLEGLNNAVTAFDTLKNVRLPAGAGRDAQAAAQPQLNAVFSTVSQVKELIKQVSLQPREENLNSAVIESQFKSVMEKSGLNLESRLASAAAMKQDGHAQAAARVVSEVKVSLKTALMQLRSELDSLSQYTLTPGHKDAIRQVREAASDVLSNLQAIQLVNHKPVSYDMLYTQIPVLLNNRIFNGEIQVWYRKGTIKENLEKSVPVNMMFMLNTTNLGNVKIQMTVYKNDVECLVSAASEKAKQALLRNKEGLLGGLKDGNFNIRAFQVTLDKPQAESAPVPGDGYVNLGSINTQA